MKKQCIMMTPSWRVPPQYCCLRRRKAKARRIIQVEKVLKITNRNNKLSYVPPRSSLKLIYYAAMNLQNRRGRRLGIPTPLFFQKVLTEEDLNQLRKEKQEITNANYKKALRSRLKKRRFYLHAKPGTWKRWRRMTREERILRRLWHGNGQN